MIVPPAAVDRTVTVQIVDDTGDGVTGLVAATFPDVSYVRAGEAAVAVNLSDLAAVDSTHSDGGVKEYSGGYYRLDLPDAAWATASAVILIGEDTDLHLLYDPILVANVSSVLANGVAHAGDTATLRLGGGNAVIPSFMVTNAIGNAVHWQSFGGNGHGFSTFGHGTGDGWHTSGGQTGDGIHADSNLGAGTGYGVHFGALDPATVASILAGGNVDGFTLEQALKICIAALAGKLSGAGTASIVIRAADDSKDRITATVDEDGNRTVITLDAAG